MRPNKKNVTGVESFDHSLLKLLPEYHVARKALDDVIHAICEHDLEVSQATWLKVAEQMAASLPYADCSGHDDSPNYATCPLKGYSTLWWPYRIVVKDGWCNCRYRCWECNYEWTCGYAVNIPELLPGG